jgi:hypothetical protein
VGGGKRPGHEKVLTFIGFGNECAVGDAVRLAADVGLDIPLVFHHAVGNDALRVVRIERVGAHADGVFDRALVLAMGFGHHEIRMHTPRLADVEVVGPIAVIDELILG